MKELDEVIKAYEVCHASVLSCEGCPYDNGERYRDSDCYIADALHYLTEYREKAHRLDIDIAEHRRSFEQLGIEIARYQEAVRNCEEAENKYRQLAQRLGEVGNDPLTWEELKQMEGKPVLVVVDGKERWRIIWEVSSEQLILESGLPLHRCWMNHPDGWQAYRKERKATGGSLTPEPKSKKIGDYTEIKWRENEKLVS